MDTRVVIENDRRPAIYLAIHEVYGEMHADAAEQIRGVVQDALQQGDMLSPDSGTLGESLFVQTPEGSDYTARRAAAKDAYLSAASYWRDVVRQVLTANAYTEDHFEERALPEEDLPSEALAAVATFIAYGWWWQMGHFNMLTERWEKRSWFLEPICQWAAASLEAAFGDFEERVIAKVGA